MGPLLFLLYYNDISKASPDINIKLFADDTNLFVHGKNIVDLVNKANLHLQCLNEWLISNKLSLNIDKTCFSVFSNKKILTDISLKIDNISIKRQTNMKYLGVYIDEKLSWSVHIEYVTKKIVRFVGIFYKIRNKIPHKLL